MLQKKKKRINFETKPTENSGKPEELWKTRKARGLLNKVSIATVNALKDDKVVNMTQSAFKRFFKRSFLLIWQLHLPTKDTVLIQ